jgi:mono/diheme cytochrome c family protein
MKLAFKKIMLSAAALSLIAALGRGAQGGTPVAPQQQPQSGNAAGAAILQRACSNCHGADAIANYHYESPDGYSDIVNSMIAAGAQMTAEEVPVLVNYLFATYGKKPQGGSAGAAPAAAEDPGKAILEAGCTSCHGLEPLANHVYDTKEPYETLIRNMVAYGAPVTDAQVGPLAEYMLKTYGKKPAAAAAPAAGNAPAAAAAPAAPASAAAGKAILEAGCTSCHGLEGLANHVYTTKEPYESLVRNMIAYGAPVTDAQVPVLVDYMFATYGKK